MYQCEKHFSPIHCCPLTHSHTLTHPLTHSLTTSVRTLPQVANHRVCTYSGGMKRRLSVALAYIGDPQILFLGKTPLPLLLLSLSHPGLVVRE